LGADDGVFRTGRPVLRDNYQAAGWVARGDLRSWLFWLADWSSRLLFAEPSSTVLAVGLAGSVRAVAARTRHDILPWHALAGGIRV
jgi:hypothetical protein